MAGQVYALTAEQVRTLVEAISTLRSVGVRLPADIGGADASCGSIGSLASCGGEADPGRLWHNVAFDQRIPPYPYGTANYGVGTINIWFPNNDISLPILGRWDDYNFPSQGIRVDVDDGPIPVMGQKYIAAYSGNVPGYLPDGTACDLPVYRIAHAMPQLMMVAITERRNMVGSGIGNGYWYGFGQIAEDYKGDLDIVGPVQGILPALMTVEKTQFTDGLTIPDVFKITMFDALSGTFKTQVDGGSWSAATPYTSWDSTTLNSLLGPTFTVGSATPTDGTGSSYFMATATDFASHTLGLDGNGLGPKQPRNLLRSLNNVGLLRPDDSSKPNEIPLAVGQRVWAFHSSGSDPTAECIKITTEDPTASPPVASQFRLRFKNVIEGGYTLTLDGGTPTSPLDVTSSASAIQAALGSGSVSGMWTIVNAAGEFVWTAPDTSPHTLTIDASQLAGDRRYRIVMSAGDGISGILSGADVTDVRGYDSTSDQYLKTTSAGLHQAELSDT